MESQEIPIEELKALGKKYGKDIMVLVSWDKLTNNTWVTTSGGTLKECNYACDIGNDIKRDVLEWPEELCNTKSNRTE